MKNIPLSFDMREISSNVLAFSDFMNFINCWPSRFSNLPPALLFCFFVLHAWLKLIIEKRVFMIEFLLCERHFSFLLPFVELCVLDFIFCSSILFDNNSSLVWSPRRQPRSNVGMKSEHSVVWTFFSFTFKNLQNYRTIL